MPKPRRLVAAADLRTFATALFAAAGVGADDAAVWSETLVWANLRGVDGHGVLRIPRYLQLLESGEIKAAPDIRVLRRAAALVLLDADRAPGPVGMGRAMQEAIAAARSVGVGWCVARSITHAGAVGRYALQAAEAGLAGLVMTASLPLMAYHGSRGAVLSTNPVAIAVPGRNGPLLLDMATSNVALGKLMQARNAGVPIPVDWGVDADGQPATDPGQVKTLLPMAGPKGSGLSLMIECLASLAAGNPVIAPALAGRGGTNMNGLAIAVDVAALGEPDEFASEVDILSDAIRAQPPASGVERLLLPGERGGSVMARRLAEGVPLPSGTWDDLAAAAASRNVPMPPNS